MESSIVSAVCIGRNCLLGNGKKIAKFLMRTFTCRSTFLYDSTSKVDVAEKTEVGSGFAGFSHVVMVGFGSH
jgi:hypothetical protein